VGNVDGFGIWDLGFGFFVPQRILYAYLPFCTKSQAGCCYISLSLELWVFGTVHSTLSCREKRSDEASQKKSC